MFSDAVRDGLLGEKERGGALAVDLCSGNLYANDLFFSGDGDVPVFFAVVRISVVRGTEGEGGGREGGRREELGGEGSRGEVAGSAGSRGEGFGREGREREDCREKRFQAWAGNESG